MSASARPGPGVLDPEDARLRDDAHLAARRGQPQRVLDEVRDDLEHAVGVRDRRRRRLGDRPQRRRRSSSRLLPVAADGVLDHLGEVDLGVVHAEVGAVHPREVEQVLDEPLEPPRLGGDGRGSLPRVDRAVLDRLGVARIAVSGVFSS